MWTVEGNRAHDFQRIPNVCTLCGLSLAPEIIPSSWYYTLYLSPDVEWFLQSRISSVSQEEKLWKEIHMCKWESTWGEKHFLHLEVLTGATPMHSESRQQAVCFF